MVHFLERRKQNQREYGFHILNLAWPLGLGILQVLSVFLFSPFTFNFFQSVLSSSCGRDISDPCQVLMLRHVGYVVELV